MKGFVWLCTKEVAFFCAMSEFQTVDCPPHYNRKGKYFS